jgi:dipeptidyl aminopeptidase/acylaminoacyl peptidase
VAIDVANRGFAMPSSSAKIEPYGSWKSPITSTLITQSIGLTEVLFDGDELYWLESRPQEDGRYVIVRAGTGDGQDVTPEPFSARTRVHEYGGGAWAVRSGTVYFSNDQYRGDGQEADRRLYRQDRGATRPVPVTPEGKWRYADGIIDVQRNRWIGVREDHSDSQKEYPDNAIVAVDLSGTESNPVKVLVSGHDFFSSPRLSTDSRRLAWLAWDYPHMPWDSSTLYVTELATDGTPARAPTIVAGGPTESVFQPEWSPDSSELLFISDRSGWWNLYSYDLEKKTARPLAPLEADFGDAQWSFGMSTYAFAGRNRLVTAYSRAGLGRLALLDLIDGKLTELDLPFTEFASVRADGGDLVAFCGGGSDIPTSIVLLDLNSRGYRLVKQSTNVVSNPEMKKYLTRLQSIKFPTNNGQTAFGLYYHPSNPDYMAPAGDKPPLIVRCHGGPTSAASTALDLRIQYWTSRGIAVLDVNYGGSTGYGRAYRDRLHLRWGIVDVDDCVNGAKSFVSRGLVDSRRVVISGSSAGGYTTLAALTFRDYFKGGASYYGVSDATALAKETHKFESHYLDWLIGPYPQQEARYRARSPVYHADRLSKPVIFFQGDEDKIVPPNQTEKMVAALRRKETPVGYLLFSGEQHGFRKDASIQRALDAELYFFAVEVFKTKLKF